MRIEKIIVKLNINITLSYCIVYIFTGGFKILNNKLNYTVQPVGVL